MNRNSHLLLLSAISSNSTEDEKENGIMSTSINSRNQFKQSHEMRAPFG